uniref:Uncharacterized protein n=1 Tax=Sphaerodactylus townsendi TaxID=933632 RepID=A0ACB8GAB0_9SAUR
MTAYNIEGVYAVQHCTGNNDCFDESENNDFYYDSDFKVHEVNFAKSCKPDNRERPFIQQSHVAEKVFWNKDFKKQCFNNKNDGLCLKDYNTRELCDMNEQNGFYSVDEFSDCDNDDFESREMNDDDEWDFENEDCNSENCEDDFESETEFDYASDYQFMPSDRGAHHDQTLPCDDWQKDDSIEPDDPDEIPDQDADPMLTSAATEGDAIPRIEGQLDSTEHTVYNM